MGWKMVQETINDIEEKETIAMKNKTIHANLQFHSGPLILNIVIFTSLQAVPQIMSSTKILLT